jgi:AraC family transcriptional regulator of arabinose operon
MKSAPHRWIAATPRDKAFLCVESVGTQRNTPLPHRFRRNGWKSWQFQFTFEGNGIGDVDGVPFEVGPGSVTILPKASNHGYECAPRCPQWIYHWIEFDGATVEPFLAMLGLDQRFAFHGCNEVRDLVERVHACVMSQGQQGRHEALARFIRIFAAIESCQTRPDAAAPPLVEAARRWLDQHLAEDICLEDCARAMKVSPWHLAHVFKAASGLPPMAFLRCLRVARAKALLQRSDRTIAAVGQLVGYARAPHFTRMFRAETGMSPKDFIKALRPHDEP